MYSQEITNVDEENVEEQQQELLPAEEENSAEVKEDVVEDFMLDSAPAEPENLLSPDILLMQQVQQIAQLSETPLPQADPYFLIWKD